MLGNLVNCVKGLFGLDGEDYDDKNFVMCESSCLCSESTSEPICTSQDIIKEFCPEEKFQLEPSFPTTTTTASLIASTPPLLELNRNLFVEPTPTYEGSATESLVPIIIYHHFLSNLKILLALKGIKIVDDCFRVFFIIFRCSQFSATCQSISRA